MVGDAIPAPLTATHGDAARGRAIVTSRQAGVCLLCHSGPFPKEAFHGTLATDLAVAGARWTEGQLRLRIADSRRIAPGTLMPAYHRTDGIAPAWREKAEIPAPRRLFRAQTGACVAAAFSPDWPKKGV